MSFYHMEKITWLYTQPCSHLSMRPQSWVHPAKCSFVDVDMLLGFVLQDVTKQQAKERAFARKQVVGQSTLDRFLSPSQEKQMQKQLATASKNTASLSGSTLLAQYRQGSKQPVLAGVKKQKVVSMEQPWGCVKRPHRQMKRLYPDDESSEKEGLDVNRSPGGKAQLQSGLSKDDDADFQPAKKLKNRSEAMNNPLQKGLVSKAKVGKGSSKPPSCAAISLQSFSYSRGDSKKSKDQPKYGDGHFDKDEVSSAQPPCRTRSKAYTGLY